MKEVSPTGTNQIVVKGPHHGLPVDQWLDEVAFSEDPQATVHLYVRTSRGDLARVKKPVPGFGIERQRRRHRERPRRHRPRRQRPRRLNQIEFSPRLGSDDGVPFLWLIGKYASLEGFRSVKGMGAKDTVGHQGAIIQAWTTRNRTASQVQTHQRPQLSESVVDRNVVMAHHGVHR